MDISFQDRISLGYIIPDRIYYSQLFIGSKLILVQRETYWCFLLQIFILSDHTAGKVDDYSHSFGNKITCRKWVSWKLLPATQCSHFLHSQNSKIFPGFYTKFQVQFSSFFNVASTYNWVSVYTLYITSIPFCQHYPKVCIPPLTATHNDLYHFERWVLI